MSEPAENPQAANDPPSSERGHRLSVLGTLADALHHWRLFVSLPVLTGVITVVVTLLMPRDYTSTASFTPSSGGGQLSQLAGVVAQFGVNVPEAETNQSPAFYAQLIQSDDILKSAVESEYRIPASESTDTVAQDLVSIFELQTGERATDIAEAVVKLRDRLSVRVDPSTGVVSVGVTTHLASLSKDLGKRLLDLLNDFNLDTRQTQAAAERRFLEGRVIAARADLRTVEDSLQAFLEHNRSYESSPRLTFDYDRLQRRVSLQQQVVTTLVQSLEQAKIDEVRNTPVITVVEPPEEPARPDRRYLLLKAVLAVILGLLVAVCWTFGLEWMRRARSEDSREYRDLRSQWIRTREELHRLGRRWRGGSDY